MGEYRLLATSGPTYGACCTSGSGLLADIARARRSSLGWSPAPPLSRRPPFLRRPQMVKARKGTCFNLQTKLQTNGAAPGDISRQEEAWTGPEPRTKRDVMTQSNSRRHGNHQTRKPLCAQAYRGFESLPLRQRVSAFAVSLYVSLKTPEFPGLCRRTCRRRRSPSENNPGMAEAVSVWRFCGSVSLLTGKLTGILVVFRHFQPARRLNRHVVSEACRQFP